MSCEPWTGHQLDAKDGYGGLLVDLSHGMR